MNLLVENSFQFGKKSRKDAKTQVLSDFMSDITIYCKDDDLLKIEKHLDFFVLILRHNMNQSNPVGFRWKQALRPCVIA